MIFGKFEIKFQDENIKLLKYISHFIVAQRNIYRKDKHIFIMGHILWVHSAGPYDCETI